MNGVRYRFFAYLDRVTEYSFRDAYIAPDVAHINDLPKHRTEPLKEYSFRDQLSLIFHMVPLLCGYYILVGLTWFYDFLNDRLKVNGGAD